jgi:hypothetical protein
MCCSTFLRNLDLIIQKMVAKPCLFLAAVVLIALSSLSCSTEKQKVTGLYNVDSLFETQIDYLIGHEAAISKKAILNGVEKITTINPKDSLAWNEELSIFFELDVVNKPIHKGTYKVEEYADNKSNLSVKSFSTTEDLPVKFLKVYYQKSLSQLRKIEAQYNESNSLYSSRRYLTMQFENVYNKTVLTSYSITGGQKMFLDDSVQYTIDANIVLKK